MEKQGGSGVEKLMKVGLSYIDAPHAENKSKIIELRNKQMSHHVHESDRDREISGSNK